MHTAGAGNVLFGELTANKRRLEPCRTFLRLPCVFEKLGDFVTCKMRKPGKIWENLGNPGNSQKIQNHVLEQKIHSRNVYTPIQI